jgi:hypothetical protein
MGPQTTFAARGAAIRTIIIGLHCLMLNVLQKGMNPCQNSQRPLSFWVFVFLDEDKSITKDGRPSSPIVALHEGNELDLDSVLLQPLPWIQKPALNQYRRKRLHAGGWAK